MTSIEEQKNKDLVLHVYQAAFGGDINAFPAAMHDDFEESVPPILPWGGVHRGAAAFLKDVGSGRRCREYSAGQPIRGRRSRRSALDGTIRRR
jgi:ketosteroid isomerase-like protein